MRTSDVYAGSFDESVPLDSSSNVCPECDGRFAPSGGESVCEDCGLVREEPRLDRGPEWRACDRAERKRTGAPVTEARHDRGLSTTIGRWRDSNGNSLSGRKRRQLGRLRREHTRSRCESKADRNRMHAFNEIRRITGVLELAESIRDQACALFRTAQGEGLLPGRSIEAVAAGCVYAVARCNGLPRTVEEVAEPAPVGRAKVEGAYRVLNAELGLPSRPLVPSEFVPRLGSELGVSDDVQHRALRLAEAAEEAGVTNGVQPSGFAAACLYKALEGSRVVTQGEVASAANTSAKTLRKHRDTLAEAGVP